MIKPEEKLDNCLRIIHNSYADIKITDDCIDDNQLIAYVNDNCTPEEQGRILDHLYKCGHCKFKISAIIQMREDEIKDSGTEEKNIVICFNCKHMNNNDAKFCEKCGYGLPEIMEYRCVHCYHPLRAESKFCPQCGKRIGAERKEKIKVEVDPMEYFPKNVSLNDIQKESLKYATSIKEKEVKEKMFGR